MLNSAIELLNAGAAVWSEWMVVTLVNTLLLALAVGAVWFLIRRHVSPQVGYVLFLLVPLKLLVPMQIALPVALPSSLVSKSETPAAQPDTLAPTATVPAIDRASPPTTLPVAAPATRSVAPRPREAALPEILPPAPSNGPAIASPSPNEPAAPLARPTPLAIGMLIWAAGVLFLSARWLVRSLRFHRQLRTAAPIDPRGYPVDLHALRRRAGVSARVRFVESDTLSAPAVAGLFRPTMILPTGLSQALSPAQIEWAVLHELAHIGRCDLAVILLQRIAAIAHFFNPAVWIANRVAHRLREYACDDLATNWSEGTPADSGEAFVQVLRYASRRQTAPAVGLGILGLDTRAACTQRVRRMLEQRRPLLNRPRRWSMLVLALVALVALPHLRAGDATPESKEPPETIEQKQPPADPTPAAGDPAKTAEKKIPAKETAGDTFELTVLGPDGKSVPNMEVEFRRPSKPRKADVRTGTFIKHQSYGTLVKANDQGRIVLDRAHLKKNIQFSIKQAGFGPYYYGDFNSAYPNRTTPNQVVIQLDAAWSVGGVVVDSQGHPIAGAEVRPSINSKRPPGAHDQIGIGTRIKTDDQGRWRFDSVPTSMEDVTVEIDHPEHMPKLTSLTRARFGIETDQEPTERIEMDAGLAVAGRVTDEAGEPIAGALLRIDFRNDERTAKTNAEGRYEIVGCQPRVTEIVVSAKGKAIDKRKIHIAPDMEPVNFEMKPGGTVRVRVLDHKGDPIPRARIFFQDWRDEQAYFAFDRVNQYANKQGVWEWHEAPHDEFTADIGQNNGMNLSDVSFKAREKEYVFRLPPALVVSGDVVDAKTNEPIKNYEIVRGLRWSNDHIHWESRDALKVTGGHYKVRFNRQYEGYLVRIQAPGYEPEVSRELEYDEGKVTLDVALKEGINVATQISTPAGKPAVGAEIALGSADSQFSVKNGRIDDGQTYVDGRATADEQGRFQFPPQFSDYHLLITHPAGYAHVKGTPGKKLEPITLTAWARVEGTFQVGDEKRLDVPLTILGSGLQSYGADSPSIIEQYDETTGPGGTFVFERVVPGRMRIGRSILKIINEGAQEVTSSKLVPIELEPGQALKIQIGGDGRPVTGTLAPPKNFDDEIIWRFADVTLQLAPPPRPDIPNLIEDDPEALQKWMEEWRKSPAGRKWVEASRKRSAEMQRHPFFRASADRHGQFRITDVPAGEYLLEVRFDNKVKLSGKRRFTVPPVTDKNRRKPLSLERIPLQKY